MSPDNSVSRSAKQASFPESVLESISDGVFTVDLDWRITSFNRAAEKITKIRRSDAIGRRCSLIFRSSMCSSECALQRTMKTGKPIIGKTGFIIKADGSRIPISISTALLKDADGRIIGGAETFRDLSEVEALRQQLAGRFQFGDLESRSPLMQKLFDRLPPIASSQSTVLIHGETGTGKERIARTIHYLSDKRKGQFIAVSCGALPDTLLESELFGYKAGAFTGAVKDKPGRFGLADGGTLFLDEIAEVSPALQVRLLRVLQERTYEPLGSTHSEATSARIIAATNKDLAKLVRRGAFREDLFYRVNVVRIELPPLRHRKEDIPILIDQFIQRFNRVQNKSILGLTTEALSLLMTHDWPGNIRELENVIERSFILCHKGMIGLGHLPEELTSQGVVSTAPTKIRSATELMEAQTIHKALKKNSFNRLAAARELGIHKSTLFRKMKRLGISAPKMAR